MLIGRGFKLAPGAAGGGAPVTYDRLDNTFWTSDNANITWSAANSRWERRNGDFNDGLTEAGTWNVGFRPEFLEVDINIVNNLYAQNYIYMFDSTTATQMWVWEGDDLTGSHTIRIPCAFTQPNSFGAMDDIARLRFGNFSSYDDLNITRIEFTEMPVPASSGTVELYNQDYFGGNRGGNLGGNSGTIVWDEANQRWDYTNAQGGGTPDYLHFLGDWAAGWYPTSMRITVTLRAAPDFGNFQVFVADKQGRYVGSQSINDSAFPKTHVIDVPITYNEDANKDLAGVGIDQFWYSFFTVDKIEWIF